ncbi:MAG: hypothetical protein ACYTX0_46550, partial [Nostoc sp.]
MARIDTTKAAAKAVAEKLAGRNQNSTSSTNSTSATSASIPIDSRIPGLLTVTPDLVPGMMPPFQPNQYHISDPLNPPETL